MMNMRNTTVNEMCQFLSCPKYLENIWQFLVEMQALSQLDHQTDVLIFT